MKRFAILALILLLFFSLALPVYADVPGELPPDSLTIDDATKAKFQLQPGETLFRVYNVAIRPAFIRDDNIADVLEGPETLGSYYASCSADGTVKVFQEDGTPQENRGFIQETVLDIFQSGEAIAKVAENIVVHNVYYLSGETNFLGSAIYYVTDRGDYVYYTSAKSHVSNCLFPVDAFCQFLEDTVDLAAQWDRYTAGKFLDGRNIWDLSVFEIDSENFDINASYPRRTEAFRNAVIVKNIILWGGIAIGVYLLIVLPARSIIRYRKRKKTEKIDQLLAE
jgi:hypothetical protein